MNKADVAELVDARDLKSLDGNVVWVRVPPPAPMANTLLSNRQFNLSLTAALLPVDALTVRTDKKIVDNRIPNL